MPPNGSEIKSNCVKQETVRKTSLIMKKKVQGSRKEVQQDIPTFNDYECNEGGNFMLLFP